VCLRQLRQVGSACEYLRRADHRTAGQQRKREEEAARHRGFPFTGKAEGRAFDFSAVSLNTG
jgi:hypothetical protein